MKNIFSNKKKTIKSGSKILTRDSKEQIYGSIEDQLLMRDMQDQSWNFQLQSQGFDMTAAEFYTSSSTGASNLDKFNLYERAFITENNELPLSLHNVSKVLACQNGILCNRDLELITTAFRTCTPGWISAFYGRNTYRDPVNITKNGSYNGGQLFGLLLERLLNLQVKHSSISEVIESSEILSFAILDSLERSPKAGFAWHSKDFNPDVIELLIENGYILRLFSGILKEPSNIVSWTLRENICKILVILLAYSRDSMTGLEIMFKSNGDSNISIFLNQIFDFVTQWVPVYLETISQEFKNNAFPRGSKRKYDADAMDEDDIPAQHTNKKLKNFALGTAGTIKKRAQQIKQMNPLKVVAGKVSKFSTTIKGSIRQVRKAHSSEPDFNERIISASIDETVKDANFSVKFDQFFVLLINIVSVSTFRSFVL